MDLVHGRRACPSLQQRRRPKDDKPGAQSFGARPTVTLACPVASHGPLSTERAILVVRFAWCCFVDHL